jgi:hypothetical protein
MEGKTPMQEFNNFLDSFIREHAYFTVNDYSLNISSLEDFYLDEFAAHSIRLDSYENDEWYWLVEDKSSKELAAQFAALLSAYKHKAELQEDFINTLLKTAINKFRSRMQGYIDDRIATVWHEDMREMSLSLHRHAYNGEQYYARR